MRVYRSRVRVVGAVINYSSKERTWSVVNDALLKVESGEGSGLKGSMSCRTQGWISMLYSGNSLLIYNFPFFCIFLFFMYFPCYSMGIFSILYFLSIFHVIQWSFFFLVFDYIAYYSMGIFVFFNFCQFSMSFNMDLRFWPKGGGTDRQMDGGTERCMYGICPQCPTGHRSFGAAA